MAFKFNPFTGTLDITSTGGGGGLTSAFVEVAVPNGTSPVASGGDTLTLSSSDSSITITGDSGTNTVDIVAGPDLVKGPASSTDNALSRFDGITGKLIKNSSAILDDLGNLSGLGNISLSGTVDGRDVSADGIVLDALNARRYALTNEYYVDSINGNDTTGDGSIGKPYLTVQKAATTISTASSNADFNLASKRYYRVRLQGSSTESVTFGCRPHIMLDLSDGAIIGNVTVQIDQGTINGAGLQSPSFIVHGSNARGFAGSAAVNGIQGDLIYESIGTGSSLVTQLHVRYTAVTGKITKKKTAPAGGYTLTLFVEGSIIAGVIEETTGDSGLTLYADNCNDSSSNSLNGITGNVNLNVINDVRFNGAVATTSTTHGRWFNTEFRSGQAHNFTGFSGTATVDANSYASFQANVPTKGTGTFVLLDDASGVKFTPTVPGNWITSPVKVNTALDELAARPTTAGSEYNVQKFTLNGTDISNGFVTLADTPTTAVLTRLIVIGGAEQDYSVDFTTTGTQLSWTGLALDGVLISGDKIIAVYN